MSRKPRRQERLTIYKKMLKTFERGPKYTFILGFCRELEDINEGLNRSKDIKNYPELMKHKPEDKPIGEFWWSIYKNSGGREIRIKVLQEVIKEMSK